MYFIEHLCDMAQKESHLEYIRMIQRDILRVVDAVAPEDGSGAANVKVIRRVRKTTFLHLHIYSLYISFQKKCSICTFVHRTTHSKYHRKTRQEGILTHNANRGNDRF